MVRFLQNDYECRRNHQQNLVLIRAAASALGTKAENDVETVQ